MQNITIANGYKTDLGANVHVENEAIDTEPSAIINIFEGDDSINEDLRGGAFLILPLNISAAIKSTTENRWSTKHKIIEDIKKCLMLHRNTKSHDISEIQYPTVQRIEQESGSNYVVVGITVNIEYHERPDNLEY
ncbi:MAG: hypothetical protein ACN4GM_13285 [Gammaproteobacteria bacterium]